jgi:cell division protein FtsQ
LEFITNSNFNIRKIQIENNSILNTDEIRENLSFLYKENLFFLNIKDVEKKLKNLTFIESFSIKKIYPYTLKLIIVEKNPIAVLQKNKIKYYISDKGDLIDFKNLEIYNDLPTVFGNENNFYSLYYDLEKIRFPLEKIKFFYFFDSGRWDLIMNDDKIIKLPIQDYLLSLKHFMSLKNKNHFNNHKIFDYRIKDQLILN